MTNVDRYEPGLPCWVDLMTSDAEAARRFYGELFGWTFHVGPPESGPYSTALLGGRKVAGLGPKPPGASFPTQWSVYFAVEHAEHTADKIGHNGGQVMMGPMDVFTEGRMAMAVDPLGAVFGIWQPQNHLGAQATAEAGTMVWHEVYSSDGARAREFYAAVFGWEARRLEGDRQLEYYTFQQGAQVFGGIMQSTERWPEPGSPHWISYFQVEDSDASAARCQDLGGRVVVAPFDTPYGRVAVLNDPQGGQFAIIAPSPSAR